MGGYNIPDRVYEIDVYAFYKCAGLTSVTIPDSLINIKWGAFSWCNNLGAIDIPDGVTSIGNWAFSGCSSLKTVRISKSVDFIGYSAFIECSSLMSFTVAPLNPVFESIEGVLYDKQQNLLIQCPCRKEGSITIPDGIASIGYAAFLNCKGLISVTLPSTITQIENTAFYRCAGLRNINIPEGVTFISDFLFDGCASLTSITIPSGVTSIGAQSFNECVGLTRVDIPNRVARIGRFAFGGCKNLKNVTIPESVATIEEAAFDNCSSLVDILIPKSVTTIGMGTFYNCGSLKSVNIPNGIKRIEVSLFAGCNSLTYIVIPKSVVNIGNSSFANCTSLKSVCFEGNAPTSDGYVFSNDPTTVFYRKGTTGWGEYYEGRPTALWQGGATVILSRLSAAFDGTAKSAAVTTIPEGLNVDVKYNGASFPPVEIGSYDVVATVIDDEFTGMAFGTMTIFSKNDFNYTANPDGTSITITKYNGLESDVIIPDAIDGKRVAGIGSRAFDNCYNITRVTIPKDVFKIEDSAFLGCSGLKGAYFKGNAPENTGIDVFLASDQVTVYYRSGTTGWGSSFAGRPAELWWFAGNYFLSVNQDDTIRLGTGKLIKMHRIRTISGFMSVMFQKAALKEVWAN